MGEKKSTKAENSRQNCLVLWLGFEQNTAAKVFTCLNNNSSSLDVVRTSHNWKHEHGFDVSEKCQVQKKDAFYRCNHHLNVWAHKSLLLTIFCVTNFNILGFSLFVKILLEAGKLSVFNLLHPILFRKLGCISCGFIGCEFSRGLIYFIVCASSRLIMLVQF